LPDGTLRIRAPRHLAILVDGGGFQLPQIALRGEVFVAVSERDGKLATGSLRGLVHQGPQLSFARHLFVSGDGELVAIIDGIFGGPDDRRRHLLAGAAGKAKRQHTDHRSRHLQHAKHSANSSNLFGADGGNRTLMPCGPQILSLLRIPFRHVRAASLLASSARKPKARANGGGTSADRSRNETS